MGIEMQNARANSRIDAKDIVRAMFEKYVAEYDALKQKPKFEAGDLPRLRELRKALAVWSRINKGE